ncbi:MAG TPA: hypothetical protein VFA56_13555 [Gaiellaceae bacterium]|nr:hypothetical protein [Gaiellaceae bacterium]
MEPVAKTRTIEVGEAGVVVSASGPLDLAAAAMLRAALARVAGHSVILDLLAAWIVDRTVVDVVATAAESSDLTVVADPNVLRLFGDVEARFETSLADAVAPAV